MPSLAGLAQLVVAHEEALISFAQRTLAGEPDALGDVRALLRVDGEPSAHDPDRRCARSGPRPVTGVTSRATCRSMSCTPSLHPSGYPSAGFDGDHYDVPAERRDDFIAAGAPVTSRELVARFNAAGLRGGVRAAPNAADRFGCGATPLPFYGWIAASICDRVSRLSGWVRRLFLSTEGVLHRTQMRGHSRWAATGRTRCPRGRGAPASGRRRRHRRLG